jgi:hypothetical protein
MALGKLGGLPGVVQLVVELPLRRVYVTLKRGPQPTVHCPITLCAPVAALAGREGRERRRIQGKIRWLSPLPTLGSRRREIIRRGIALHLGEDDLPFPEIASPGGARFRSRVLGAIGVSGGSG